MEKYFLFNHLQELLILKSSLKLTPCNKLNRKCDQVTEIRVFAMHVTPLTIQQSDFI